MTTPSVLQRLLGEQPASVFLRETYLRFPHYQPTGVAAALENLDALALVAEILQHEPLDVIVGREGQLKARQTALGWDAARAFLAEGQTIGLRHVERAHPRLDELARTLEIELGAPVDVHMYWTPANSPGFGWHFDAEEVFVLQLLGTKTWRLRKNTVFPWPVLENLPADQRYEREVMPVRSYGLETGSWLYIPSGFWHATQADQESLSLSIGLRAPVAVDVLELLRPMLLESIEWRERLPCRGSAADYAPDELEAAYAEILQRLSSSLTSTLNSPALIHKLVHGTGRPAADDVRGD